MMSDDFNYNSTQDGSGSIDVQLLRAKRDLANAVNRNANYSQNVGVNRISAVRNSYNSADFKRDSLGNLKLDRQNENNRALRSSLQIESNTDPYGLNKKSVINQDMGSNQYGLPSDYTKMKHKKPPLHQIGHKNVTHA